MRPDPHFPTDRGSVTLEVAALVPVLLLLIVAVIVAGRVQVVGQATELAAYDAARQASLARNPTTARISAEHAAREVLTHQKVACHSLVISVDTRGFAVPTGHPSSVHTKVSCVVRLEDLGVPWLPGSRTVQATFTSPLDTYRQR